MTKFVEHRSKRRKATKSIIVLYHAECSDGFGAAWAAWRHFGDRAEYHPTEHQSQIPIGLNNKEIYMLDFTYPEEVTRKLIADNKRVTAIDHHISVADVTLMTTDGIYDNNHSGSVLAWNFFNPDTPVPFLLRIIEDNDLYRFDLPETKDILDWLDLYDFRFEKFNELAIALDDNTQRARAIEEGRLIRSYQEKMVERLISNTAFEVEFQGHNAGIINTEQFHSECANKLAEKYDIGVAWRVRPHGTYVSLRSRGLVDVAKLAGQYGGGGHSKSAGFIVASPTDLPFEIVLKKTNIND